MSAADRVLTALAERDCNPRGGGRNGSYSARCPAHADRTPSLSVTRGEDRVLLHCHAGCEFEDVLSALDLGKADLFDEASPLSSISDTNGMPDYHGKPIVKSYDYVDEHGRVLYRVGRTAAKDFPIFHPDGNGGWNWGLNGARRVLYRLPEVIAAVERGDVVYVVEGEKDADTLSAAGVTATTSPGGADKWRDEYAHPLHGGHVRLVADRDDPGRAHAARVAESLEGVASSVEVFEPADGKDVSDHLAAGRGLDELVATHDDLPPDGLIAISAASVRPRNPAWLWPDRIPLAGLTLLIGDPGLGKSMLTCDLAAQVSRGGTAVLMATAEDDHAAVMRPRLEAANADLDRIGFLKMWKEGLQDGLTLPRDVHELERLVREHAAQLVVIDPFTAHLAESVNSWNDQSVRRALAPLYRTAVETGCAVLIVAHLNKGNGSDPLLRGGGSIGIPGAARSALLMARDPDDPDGEMGQSRVLAHYKSNWGREAPSLRYNVESATVSYEGDTIETARIRLVGESDRKGSDLLSTPIGHERSEREEARDFLLTELADGPRPAKEVQADAREAGITDATLRRAKQDLRVESARSGFGGEGRFDWRLPEGSAIGAQGGCAPIGAQGGCASMENPADRAESGPSKSPENSIGAQSPDIEHLWADDDIERIQRKWGDAS